jgi:MFS family permease
MESRDTFELRQDYPAYVAAMERNYGWNLAAFVVDRSFFGLAIAFLAYNTVLPYFVRQLSHRSVFVGLISAIYFAFYSTSQLVGAYLVHGQPRRKPFILTIAILERVGVILMALTAGLVNKLPVAWVLIMFFLALTVKSTSEGLIIPGYSDFVSKSMPVRRGTYFAVTSIAGGLVGIAGTYVIKFILSSYAFPLNFSLLFWLALGVSVISLGAIACYREEDFPDIPQKESFGEYLREIPRVLHTHDQFHWYIVIRALVRTGTMASSFFSVYAIERFGLGPGAVGEFTLIMTAAVMVVTTITAWLGDRRGYKAVLEIAALLGSLAPLMILLFPHQRIGYTVFALMSCGLGAATLAELGLVLELSPPRETARFVGIANTVVSPFIAVGPLLGGWLVDGVSYHALFAVSAVLSATGLFLSRAVLREPRVMYRSSETTYDKPDLESL